MKKTLIAKIAAMSMAITLLAGLTACGSNEAPADKTLNGYYTSTQNVSFFSAYPAYTFKQATFSVQTLETYADGTYCLTSIDSNFSGTLTFADDGNHEEVPRGVNSTKYFGAFTSSEESGLLTVTLSAPTSVAVASNYSVGEAVLGYLNTAAWTDEMGTLAGGENGAMSAEDYLASVAFGQVSVIIDTAPDTFDYTVLNPAA